MDIANKSLFTEVSLPMQAYQIGNICEVSDKHVARIAHNESHGKSAASGAAMPCALGKE
jgi:hypothetical protein